MARIYDKWEKLVKATLKREEDRQLARQDSLSSTSSSSSSNFSFLNQVVEWPLSSRSILKIWKGDITQWSVDGSSDAIVNSAIEMLLGGGGLDGAIHRAAGPELLLACYDVPEVKRGVRCPTGEARITPGFCLPASHVIHTVGPIYETDEDPETSLRNAYRSSLRIAKENNIQFIAFPAVSCGIYRYLHDKAAAVAISTVKEYAENIKEVRTLFDILKRFTMCGLERPMNCLKTDEYAGAIRGDSLLCMLYN